MITRRSRLVVTVLLGILVLRIAAPAHSTPDEQARLCTTDDLTWEVEYVRTIRRG